MFGLHRARDFPIQIFPNFEVERAARLLQKSKCQFFLEFNQQVQQIALLVHIFTIYDY